MMQSLMIHTVVIEMNLYTVENFDELVNCGTGVFLVHAGLTQNSDWDTSNKYTCHL